MNPDNNTQQSSTITRTSRDGYEFDVTSTHWKLSRDVTTEVESLRAFMCPSLFHGYISALADCATTHSGWHVHNMNSSMKLLLRQCVDANSKLDCISPILLINFKATLNKKTEWLLGRMVSFLKKWAHSPHFGVEIEVVSLLDGWTFTGNQKGEAVRLRDPRIGPLTAMEFSLFEQRLLDAFEDNEVNLEDYTLTRIFSASGRRPTQIADGKWCDYAPSNDPNVPGILKIARRKGEGSGFRILFKEFPLSPDLDITFKTLKAESFARTKSLLPGLNDEFLNLLPIFPSWTNLESFSSSSSSVIESALKGEALHSASYVLGRRLTKVVDRLAVTSDRIPGPIHITGIRLRRTLATRAARAGLSTLLIADLLDHDDTQNAGVYTENVPENVNAINDAVADQMAPLMRAFRGEIIPSEQYASRGSDKTSRIRTGCGTGAGSCAKCGDCLARAPLACYTCRAFQPWLDGDHEAVLSQLLDERANCSDVEIAEACDLTIFAVREVILLCQKKKAEVALGAAT